jgi:hypothetical protein
MMANLIRIGARLRATVMKKLSCRVASAEQIVRTVHFEPANLLSRSLSCIYGGHKKSATKDAE